MQWRNSYIVMAEHDCCGALFLVSKKMSNQKYLVERKIRREEEMPYPFSS